MVTQIKLQTKIITLLSQDQYLKVGENGNKYS